MAIATKRSSTRKPFIHLGVKPERVVDGRTMQTVIQRRGQFSTIGKGSSISHTQIKDLGQRTSVWVTKNGSGQVTYLGVVDPQTRVLSLHKKSTIGNPTKFTPLKAHEAIALTPDAAKKLRLHRAVFVK